MSAVIAKLKPLLNPPLGKHTGTIIFLHGSGDTGFGIKMWLQTLYGGADVAFNNIRIIYPTAPERGYSAAGGQVTNVWFDRKQISPNCSEDRESTEEMCENISQLIDLEEKRGVARNRIILGGFSMGGAMSLYYGLKYGRDLCALFALSSFLAEDSQIYKELADKPGRLPPVFQCHGTNDPLVHYNWGKATSDKLAYHGVDCTFNKIKDMYHEMSMEEVDLWKEWVLKQIPLEE